MDDFNVANLGGFKANSSCKLSSTNGMKANSSCNLSSTNGMKGCRVLVDQTQNPTAGGVKKDGDHVSSLISNGMKGYHIADGGVKKGGDHVSSLSSNGVNGYHEGLVMGCHDISSIDGGVKKDGDHVSSSSLMINGIKSCHEGVMKGCHDMPSIVDGGMKDGNHVSSLKFNGMKGCHDKASAGVVKTEFGNGGAMKNVSFGVSSRSLEMDDNCDGVGAVSKGRIGCLTTISGLDKKIGVVDIGDKGEDLLNEVLHRDNNGHNFQVVVGDMCKGQIIQRMDDSHGRIFQHKDANIDINGQNCQRKVVVDDLPPLNKSIQQGMGVIESKCGALGSISGIGNVGHEIGANGADSTKLDGPRINVIESP